jgi:hypothetical protein
MEARILPITWPPGELAPGDRMVAAREARYQALLLACSEEGRSHLLLGHHADDQAETFLLRLLHASGVLGLACMPRVSEKRAGVPRLGDLCLRQGRSVYTAPPAASSCCSVPAPTAGCTSTLAWPTCRGWWNSSTVAPSAGVPQG